MFDYFTVWHILGTFGIGLLLGFFVKRFKRAIVVSIILPIFWEVFEQNILVSWTGILEPEPLMNSLGDIAVGIPFILLGFYVFKLIMRMRGVPS